MHVVIINGSPRVKEFSNTDKILAKFTEGLTENGTTFEQYEVSDRKQWDAIRTAYNTNKNILMAIPLYVENIPGLLLEFLKTLTPKNDGTQLSFILQGGFAEGSQLRCGEAYLEILAGELGCEYGGTLAKGDNFSIRFFGEQTRERVTSPYKDMGREFAAQGNFKSEACRKFTGPETFPLKIRILVGTMFATVARKSFKKIAAGLGCTKSLKYRPYK